MSFPRWSGWEQAAAIVRAAQNPCVSSFNGGGGTQNTGRMFVAEARASAPADEAGDRGPAQELRECRA